MFRRQPKAEAVPPITANEQHQQLQTTIDALRRENAELRTLLLIDQDSHSQIQDVLRDLERNISHLTRPTVQALLALEIEALAALPLALADQQPGAPEEFQRFVQRPASHYLSPARAAAELLKYRLHTVLQMLTKIIHGENVGPSDVHYQATHDLNVLNNHERQRHEQRLAEQGRAASGKPPTR